MGQENPYNIRIDRHKMGNDFVFLITGGQAHIGAVATAYWHNNEVNVVMNELPHHKEGELSRECAELACRTLGCTCSVLIGIHLDNATKEQIEYIVSYVRQGIKHTLEEIKNVK